jgi:hypothetical protein
MFVRSSNMDNIEECRLVFLRSAIGVAKVEWKNRSVGQARILVPLKYSPTKCKPGNLTNDPS